MTSIVRTGTVDASVDDVWAVLADFGAIAAWAPEVDHSCRLDEGPVGVGATRRVQVGRLVLVERITRWAPPDALAYRLEGLPPIVGTVTNAWRLRPEGGRTTATLTTTVDAGARPPGPLVARLAARRLAKASDSMLTGLERHRAVAVSR